jgi:hypothetical protein
VTNTVATITASSVCGAVWLRGVVVANSQLTLRGLESAITSGCVSTAINVFIDATTRLLPESSILVDSSALTASSTATNVARNLNIAATAHSAVSVTVSNSQLQRHV